MQAFTGSKVTSKATRAGASSRRASLKVNAEAKNLTPCGALTPHPFLPPLAPSLLGRNVVLEEKFGMPQVRERDQSASPY